MKKTSTFLFVCLFMLAAMYGCTNAPAKVADQFLHALQARDFTTMKALSTRESQEMIALMENLSHNGPALPKDNSAPLAIKNTDTHDSTAIVTYCCDANNDGKDTKLVLKKTPSGWKVDGWQQ